ncbi:MAG: sulfatase-like hydrolase/transferase [Actinobacteria bacterium]|nr:sulfatase-like hydrolase/transferase [Actinomycetota bacterium]
MSARHPLTRRALLRGGGGAAGVAALGGLSGLAGTALAASGRDPRERPNVVLIMADRLRADALKSYDDVLPNSAHTPSLDALADESLRFRYFVPDGLPAIPARRALLTGMRSYPFRDWRATAGVPAIPGWHKIWDFQPLMPELVKASGVETVYVTDNPLLSGPRFDFVRRTGKLPLSAGHTSTERSYFQPLRRAPLRREPTTAVLDEGVRLIDELKGKQPFFLGLDAFDPVDAFEMPRQYVLGEGPVQLYSSLEPDYFSYQQTVKVHGAGLADTVRELYAREVRQVDDAVGRLLHKLDAAGLGHNTVVIFASEGGIGLGEQGTFGHPAGMWHRRVYQAPLLVRDPRRRWAGETSSWFASTHDVPTTILSYLDVVIPGKMAGEDLTTLFDDDDLPGRLYFTSGIDTHLMAGDREWLLIGRSDEDQWRLYHLDDTDKPDDVEDKTVTAPTVLQSIREFAIWSAGGTLPEFGHTSALRPNKPDEKTTVASDGTLNQDEQDAQRLGVAQGG